MVAALLTTFLFALSGVTNQRVAVRLGAQWGNFIRLAIACALLAFITLLLMRDSLHLDVFKWFFLSGIVGFGVGDVALFAAFTRIGSRLTVLLTLCLAPIFALIVEWFWLGDLPSVSAILCMVAILTGVTLSIGESLKKLGSKSAVSVSILGIIASVIAGFGQGVGTVISRKALKIADENGVTVFAVSAAFQRIFAGVVVGALVVFILKWVTKKIELPTINDHFRIKLWLIGAALFGPVLGVSCFQWALQSMQSSVVLAITSLTPIVLMPMAAVTEKDKPTLVAVIGAAVAVAGVSIYFGIVKTPG